MQTESDALTKSRFRFRLEATALTSADRSATRTETLVARVRRRGKLAASLRTTEVK
jgi:hypothetical protein